MCEHFVSQTKALDTTKKLLRRCHKRLDKAELKLREEQARHHAAIHKLRLELTLHRQDTTETIEILETDLTTEEDKSRQLIATLAIERAELAEVREKLKLERDQLAEGYQEHADTIAKCVGAYEENKTHIQRTQELEQSLKVAEETLGDAIMDNRSLKERYEDLKAQLQTQRRISEAQEVQRTSLGARLTQRRSLRHRSGSVKREMSDRREN